jgi:hypothetical protein
VVHFLVGRIEFHDKDANLVRLARVPYPSDPKLETNDAGQVQWAMERGWYYDCTATHDFLYTLFSGRQASAYDEDARASGEFVHVFDWDGNLKAAYRLDRDIRAIAISPAGTQLFAASIVDGGIYRFDLPPMESNDASGKKTY